MRESERNEYCLKAGREFNQLMTFIADDVAADALGVKMKKDGSNITATVTDKAAEIYRHPGTDRTLGEILDDLKDNCSGILPVNISKDKDKYTVTQSLKKP